MKQRLSAAGVLRLLEIKTGLLFDHTL